MLLKGPLRRIRILFSGIAAAAGWGCAHGSGADAVHVQGGGAVAHGAGDEQPAMHHRFEDAQRWSALWDASDRDAWQQPDRLLSLLSLSEDDRVADIGAGTGYFAMRFAAAVPAGKVYAIDVEPDMVAFMRKRADEAGLDNIVPVLASPDDPKLPQPVDLIFLCNTYHHISERRDYFSRLRQRIRPGGRLVIVDYKKHAGGHGPPAHHRMAAPQVVDELRAAGYGAPQTDRDLLPYQYVIIAAVASH